MSSSRAIALAIVIQILLVHAALAQSIGYQLNRYEPAPAGDAFFQVEHPWYSSTRFFAGGLTLDYAHDLLGTSHRDAGGAVIQDPPPIGHQLTGHVDLAGSMFDRVALTLSLPVLLYEAGTPFNGLGPSGTIVGDPRIGARVRLFGQPDRSKISLSGGVYVWIPVGAQGSLAGDSGVRFMPKLIAGGLLIGRLRWTTTLAFLYRGTARLSSKVSATGNVVGSELQIGTGLQYLAFDRRLAVGPEINLSLGVSGDLPAGQSIALLELLLGAHYLVADQVTVGLGIGAGVLGSPGLPDLRLLFSVAYSPRRPFGVAERVVVLPDADGHVGAVAVDDGKKVTLLDKAYASSEVGHDGKVTPVQSSALAVQQKVAALGRALPPSDRDGDGILDDADACPDRAGVASADPLRHGCPKSTEKVVVLPDEDGHVGGIEVDDGKSVTVLDQPFASSEVAADGTAQRVPDSPPAAIKRSVAALSGQLPAGDLDGDGIPDGSDACPTRAGVASKDPVRNGCPPAVEKVVVLPDADGHVGGVAVDDGKSVTVLDQPYATAEVGTDGAAHAEPPSPARSVERSVGALAKLLPVSDRDGDGIADGDDACPDRKGFASADPVRNGCPKAVEKVVVLPDADGHVGGVEVNDGKSVTVLDKPYATAEVGADGAAHAVAPSPARSIERSVAALQQLLPVADRDGDGIPDGVDACPDRKGHGNVDPVRNGCPEAVEKVVVLPDADGHVGGVEVNDGKKVTVLDKAYATAEVGADGVAHAVPPSPAQTVERSVAALQHLLPVADRDGDGILDEADACPDRKGLASADPVRNGCPKALEKVVVLPDADGHVGAVAVDDGKKVTLLDKAYASSEVGTDGRAEAVQSSPAAAARSVAAVAATLPVADRDGDGIADKDDACPDRAGLANAEPARNGCPKTLEKVVVLPDENGHVGAVEVDDGKQKIVLDQAYATAEVGTDGAAHKTETAPTEVARTFAGALAARPPGARMVIYFNERAQPASDLTGPIANIVEETRNRATYTIEVVGHTDAIGSPASNLKLGQQRAQLIADRLIAAGVPEERVRVQSKGATAPVVVQKNLKVGEPRNRRVEVFVR